MLSSKGVPFIEARNRVTSCTAPQAHTIILKAGSTTVCAFRAILWELWCGAGYHSGAMY